MYSFTEFEKPIRGTVGDLPVIIIGVLGDTRFLAVDSEGVFMDILVTEAKADYRFDYQTKEWANIEPMQPDE